MIDISSKTSTLRTALAQAKIFLQPEVLAIIREHKAPKGDVLEAAKITAVMAVKNTPQIIPYCHPLPIDGIDVRFAEEADGIVISVRVSATHKTGVEMEALTGASVAALMIYDMIKFTDTPITIGEVKLIQKKGGKSDYVDPPQQIKAAVLVLSDTIARGGGEDTSGKRIVDRLKGVGVTVEDYAVIADEAEDLRSILIHYCDELKLDLVITTGGTGLGPRDITPDVVAKLLDTEIPGIMEAARAYGQSRMPYSILSRGIAGVRGNTVIVTLPGSKGGVEDSLNAILKPVLHLFRMMSGARHG
jgi:cyclic pyranopterin phosphate synthase